MKQLALILVAASAVAAFAQPAAAQCPQCAGPGLGSNRPMVFSQSPVAPAPDSHYATVSYVVPVSYMVPGRSEPVVSYVWVTSRRVQEGPAIPGAAGSSPTINLFDRYDTDSSESLERSEWSAVSSEPFSSIDINENDSISREEFRRWRSRSAPPSVSRFTPGAPSTSAPSSTARFSPATADRSARRGARQVVPTLFSSDRTAARHARGMSWHSEYAHTATGLPVALVVPPTAHMQTNWSWGVAQGEMTPIYHQFRRSYPGSSESSGGFGSSQPAGFLPTPNAPSTTHQFGVNYVRGPY